MEKNSTFIIGLLAVALLVSAMGTLTVVTKTTGLAISLVNTTVSAVGDITLTTSSVDFGGVYIGIAEATSDESPPPFVVLNDGSADIDVTVRSAAGLFSLAPATSAYYRVKCRAGTTACGAGSQTSYINMPIGGPVVATKIIGTLGFTNFADDNKVDIEITAPYREPMGAVSANITFTATVT